MERRRPAECTRPRAADALIQRKRGIVAAVTDGDFATGDELRSRYGTR